MANVSWEKKYVEKVLENQLKCSFYTLFGLCFVETENQNAKALKVKFSHEMIDNALGQGCPKSGPWEKFLRPASGLITYVNYIAYGEENLAVVAIYFPDFLNFCTATNSKVTGFQTS